MIARMDANLDRHNLLWNVRKSQRYHARRMAFFDRWHKVTGFVGVLGASAVFVAMAEHVPVWLATTGAGLVVVMSSIDLVVGFSVMARCHNDLRRRFCLLEAAIAAKPEAKASELARWTEERLNIEADEPPVYVALDLQCDNELRRATGRDPEPLGRFMGLTAHWLRWENA